MRCLHLGVSIRCLYWDYLCYLLTNYNKRCDDDDESVDKLNSAVIEERLV